MMHNTKSKLILLICTVLSLMLIFGGCTVAEDSEQSRKLCENMVDSIIRDDYTSAYAMVQTVASQSEFDPLWHAMRDSLENSTSYELQQKNWYKKWSNGTALTQVLFEITTDDGKICQMLVSTLEGNDGIAGLNFLDSTDFVQETSSLGAINIFLIVFSLLCFAFSIWMFVDCLKRRPSRKILWAILTLCYIGGSLTFGASDFSINFRISFFWAFSNISADRTALAVTTSVFLPIGAIVYFFMRKRLTPPQKENTDAMPEGQTETDGPAPVDTQ